jgi:predicted phosphodiesterase
VELLISQAVDMILHLGDVGSVEVLDELVVAEQPARVGAGGAAPGGGAEARVVDVRLVFGNVDWDRLSLSRYAQYLGLTVADPVGRLEVEGGRQLVYLHGDDSDAMAAALRDQPAYLCHGHSHRQRDEKIGPTRIVNPGALFRAQLYSVAVLDTLADQVTFLTVE